MSVSLAQRLSTVFSRISLRAAAPRQKRVAHRARSRRLFEQLEPRTLLSATPLNNTSYIDLGTSDNIAWDQPRGAVELLTPVGGSYGSVGPAVFNTFLLDTGANTVIAFATAVTDMIGPPYAYTTSGLFEELGVAGSQIFDISDSYRLDFAGNSGVRHTIPDGRILSDANNDISIFGPWGIFGMPAMVDRVTTLDMTPWTTISGFDFFMQVEFSDEPPDPLTGVERYTLAVNNEPAFSPDGHIIWGNAPPVWADVPFFTATPVHNGDAAPGNFLFDTGAQVSVMSTQLAKDIGLDSNGDGVLNEHDANYARTEVVGGIGGTIEAPVFLFDEVHVATEQDVDLVWTDLQWLVLDIFDGIDGVFGSDLITSGWIEGFAVDGKSGYFMQVQLDFREMDDTGVGKVHFDLNPEVNYKIDPDGPGARVIETGGSTTVSENGVDDTYQIALTEQPTANVRIDLANSEGQLTVVDAAQPTHTYLTFTPANWDDTQTVRVLAVQDSDEEGFRRSSIVHASSSSDPRYQAVGMPRVVTNIIDDDFAGVMMIPSDGSTDVTEAGGQDTYQVVLTSMPFQDVRIWLEHTQAQVTVVDHNNPANNSLLFTPSNWNVPQTVRVSAVDDTLEEGPHEAFVTHRIATNDDAYQQAFVLQEVVSITDNDGNPFVVDHSINGSGNTNRSAVAKLALQFDQAVTVGSATSLKIFNHTTGSSLDISAATLQNNGTSEVTWDLSGVSFPDGYYTAELPAAAATSAQGKPLAATHAFLFHVLAGDGSGNAEVDFADFTVLTENFNTINGPILGPGDLDGNGDVDFNDFTVLTNTFNNILTLPTMDLGDAPEAGNAYPTTVANSGARHILGSGLALGAGVDAEADGQPDGGALGDDNAGDDEDGVTLAPLQAGTNAGVTVTATVPDSAVLNAWIDFNADGDWDDSGEQVFVDQALTGGVNNLTAAIPSGATAGATFARFRVTGTAGYSYFGLAPDGEVEDYQVTILAGASSSLRSALPAAVMMGLWPATFDGGLRAAQTLNMELQRLGDPVIASVEPEVIDPAIVQGAASRPRPQAVTQRACSLDEHSVDQVFQEGLPEAGDLILQENILPDNLPQGNGFGGLGLV